MGRTIRRKPSVVSRQDTRQGQELRRAQQAAARQRQTVPVYSESATGSDKAHGLDPSGQEDLFSGGRLVSGLSMSASSTKAIRHGLGREPTRWMFVSVFCTGAVAVTLHAAAVNSDTITIRNHTSDTVTFDLYVK